MARCAVAAAMVCFVLAPSAQADIVEFELSYEFSGATPPAGPTPWPTATFDDQDTLGSVNLRLEAGDLIDQEYVSEWLFNLDPTMNPNSLGFSQTGKYGNFTDPFINTGVDFFQANGDGFFDIQFLFDSTDGTFKKFDGGESVEYEITGIATLDAHSFDYLSFQDGGLGTFPTAGSPFPSRARCCSWV